MPASLLAGGGGLRPVHNPGQEIYAPFRSLPGASSWRFRQVVRGKGIAASRERALSAFCPGIRRAWPTLFPGEGRPGGREGRFGPSAQASFGPAFWGGRFGTGGGRAMDVLRNLPQGLAEKARHKAFVPQGGALAVMLQAGPHVLPYAAACRSAAGRFPPIKGACGKSQPMRSAGSGGSRAVPPSAFLRPATFWAGAKTKRGIMDRASVSRTVKQKRRPSAEGRLRRGEPLTSYSVPLPAGTWAYSGTPGTAPWPRRRTPGSSSPIPPSWARRHTMRRRA